jgi:hypothetical protein
MVEIQSQSQNPNPNLSLSRGSKVMHLMLRKMDRRRRPEARRRIHREQWRKGRVVVGIGEPWCGCGCV